MARTSKTWIPKGIEIKKDDKISASNLADYIINMTDFYDYIDKFTYLQALKFNSSAHIKRNYYVHLLFAQEAMNRIRCNLSIFNSMYNCKISYRHITTSKNAWECCHTVFINCQAYMIAHIIAFTFTI